MILANKLQGKTPLQKLRWLHRAQELLRLQHNQMGADFRNGLITQQEWDDYVAQFETRNSRLLRAMTIVRDNIGLTDLTPEERDQSKAIFDDGRDAVDLDTDIDVTTVE